VCRVGVMETAAEPSTAVTDTIGPPLSWYWKPTAGAPAPSVKVKVTGVPTTYGPSPSSGAEMVGGEIEVAAWA
jgi:hypothetical protein